MLNSIKILTNFRSEVESELDFERRPEHGGSGGARGGGEALCDRLELPHGVTGVESCRSASPGTIFTKIWLLTITFRNKESK